MTAIVVPGVCRFTLNQKVGDVEVNNIIDMHLDTDGGAARGEAIEDQAQIINANWVQCFAPVLSGSWGMFSTSWVDLDSADGEVGETSEAQEGVTLPVGGGVTGDPLPTNVAYLIRKTTTGGRRARHGRWFVAGVPEAGQIANAPSPSTVSALGTALPALLSALNQSGRPPLGVGTGLYDSRMVVVHRPAVGTPSASNVGTLILDGLLATQRDRLRP